MNASLCRWRGEVRVPEAVEWPEDDIPDAAGPSSPGQAPILVPPPVPPSPMPRVGPPPPPLGPVAIPVPPLPTASGPRRRSGAVTVAAIGVLAAVAVGLVVVAIVASGGDKPPAVAATPTTQAPEPPPSTAAGPGPVTDLRLTDNGESVVAEWGFPAGAAGPVIVSAAPAGEPMRAMQSLPQGTRSYTLLGLNPKRDYCVAVTIAYSTERMVMSEPVCTSRANN